MEKAPNKKGLKKITRNVDPVGDVNFYYPSILDMNETELDIENKIKKISELITKYSEPKIKDKVGKHLHNLVRNELQLKKFTIINEHTNKYKDKIWSKSNHTLDIIAAHNTKNLTVGIEIKNSLDDLPKKEVDIKIKMCKSFGIIPIFACRFTYHKKFINENGGFCWDFKHQIYPENKAYFVKPLQGRLNLPIIACSKIPKHSSMEFTRWVKNY